MGGWVPYGNVSKIIVEVVESSVSTNSLGGHLKVIP